MIVHHKRASNTIKINYALKTNFLAKYGKTEDIIVSSNMKSD